MVEFGLFLIVAAWFLQVMLLLRGKRELNPYFLALYSIGLTFLVITGFNLGPTLASYFNASALTLAIFSHILLKL